MKIKYYFRSKDAGFSIGRVFEPIMNFIGKTQKVESVYMPSKYAGFIDLIKNCMYAYKEAKKNKDAIHHITGEIYYLCWVLPSKSLVVTVHDIWFYTENKKSIKMLLKYLLWIYPLKRAAKVTFISEASKDQVLKHIKLRNDQIEIVENPVAPEYKASKKNFDKIKPIILHLGMSYSKNLANLIPALKGLSCHLRLIGNLKPEYKTLLEENNIDYSWACNLTNEEVVAEYANCDIVNLTSLHEGFGMPIIEGQKSNKVVVTSNISPMKNIAGKGAALVDPTNQEDIHNVYKRVIEDDDFRNNILDFAKENITKYSVENISHSYVSIYNKLK